MAKNTSRPKDGTIRAPAEESHAARPVSEARALAICAHHGNRADELLEILHAIQNELGHVPETTLPVIANALNLSRAEIHGVVTFYHDFRHEPAGRHVIKVCRAEACQSLGAEKTATALLERLGIGWGETTADGTVTVEAIYCLGLCACAPAALIDGDPLGRLDGAKLAAAVEEVRWS